TATLSKADGSATEAPHNRVVTLLETYIDVN
ncbi:MAG: hypothetical protein JWP55_1080, partial [Mycobacterium sp.]|nr:hypothetical protein [Mycobacterium sp.]